MKQNMKNRQIRNVRVIAFYLPQFHPIPENDKWYGKGFTEWTNVGRAKPLFKGHYQPRIPADLGYYDLRLPEVREQQAELAKEYGIEGFCYWHYWFGDGRTILEKPFLEVLKTNKPDFPFCLAWANHSWFKKTWDNKSKDRLLLEQKYLGAEDNRKHFFSLLPAFKDERYIKVNNKLFFVIYAPFDMPGISDFIEQWNLLAKENGFDGFYFVAQGAMKDKSKIISLGFDAIYTAVLTIYEQLGLIPKSIKYLKKKIFRIPVSYTYSQALDFYCKTLDSDIKTIPSIIPNWDHSPRSGTNGFILTKSTPKIFYKYLKIIMSFIKDKPKDERILFLRSWNEWGEGNYIEPDLKYGRGYLEALKRALDEF